MKKTLHALMVICLSVIGANALASSMDMNVSKISVKADNQESNQNGNGDRGGGRNMTSREK